MTDAISADGSAISSVDECDKCGWQMRKMQIPDEFGGEPGGSPFCMRRPERSGDRRGFLTKRSENQTSRMYRLIRNRSLVFADLPCGSCPLLPGNTRSTLKALIGCTAHRRFENQSRRASQACGRGQNPIFNRRSGPCPAVCVICHAVRL